MASRSVSGLVRSVQRALSPASASRRSLPSPTLQQALKQQLTCHSLPMAAFDTPVTSPRRWSLARHSVMIGGLFAGTEESPGEVELYQGRSYKSYRGMGSIGAMGQSHGSSDRYFQDATEELEKAGSGGRRRTRCLQRFSLVAIVHQLIGGVRAAMGYTGSSNIEEMRTRPQFVQDHGGRHERKPRPRRNHHQRSPRITARRTRRENYSGGTIHRYSAAKCSRYSAD